MKTLGVMILLVVAVIAAILFIPFAQKSQKEPEGLEPEIEQGDFFLLEDLSERIKKGENNWSSLDLQLQSSYPKRLEWMLNKGLTLK